ncbi:MAG: hypothetical protein HKP09_09005, partial [Enterobacterales bacterium]|nr:hypothetical protein [Enterobacterales bacterium]
MTKQQQNHIQPSERQATSHFSQEIYQHAEQQALWYFREIQQRQSSTELFDELVTDISRWNSKARQSPLKTKYQWLSLDDMDSWTFLQKLSAEGELKNYLLKTIRYIFIRDLGMRLDNRQTDKLIDGTVKKILSLLRKQDGKQSFTDTQGLLYQWTSKRGLDTTYQWLMLKLAQIEPLFINDAGRTHGMRKLVKIIAGVVLHHLIIENQEHSDLDAEQLDTVIRLGYCYGLTYPFIDDLQDSAIALNAHDKGLFNAALRTSLQTGEAVAYPDFEHDNERLRHIYRELKWAFEFIKSNLSEGQADSFFKRAYVFFEAQDIDRQRSLAAGKRIKLADLYLPVMLKSAGCRLIARDLVTNDSDKDFDYRTFCFGIYNQFNDDIKDIFEDIEQDNLTPYSYYLTYGSQTANNENPYSYYWAVVHYLINDVYHAEPITRTLLIERCINAHKSLLQSIGEARYLEL